MLLFCAKMGEIWGLPPFVLGHLWKISKASIRTYPHHVEKFRKCRISENMIPLEYI